MLAFRSSERLATAYGVSVTGALVVDTLLLLLVAPGALALAPVEARARRGRVRRRRAHLPRRPTSPRSPTAAGCRCSSPSRVFTVMTTWRRGRRDRRDEPPDEGGLARRVRRGRPRPQSLPRVPGHRGLPAPEQGHHAAGAAGQRRAQPRAARAACSSCPRASANVPHVPVDEAFAVDDLGYADDGIEHLTVRFGFSDEPDIPAALREACARGVLDAPRDRHRRRVVLPLPRGDPPDARTGAGPLAQDRCSSSLAHNAADPAAHFGLPPTAR